jgi:O-antigen ligase
MACLLVPVLVMLGNRYQDRMATLTDVQGESSAASRLVFSRAAFHMWQDHPLFGVGFGQDNYRELNYLYLDETATRGLVVHNTYLQILVDSGIITFLLFVGTLWGTVWWLGRSAKKIKAVRPDLVPYARSLQLSTFAYAIGCTFYSRPQFEIFYIVLGGAAAWQLVIRNILSAPVPLTAEPVPRQLMAVQAEARP